MRPGPAVALILAAVLAAPPLSAQEAVRIDAAGFEIGGLSGIEVTADGAGFLALSDRGVLVEGVLERDAGALTAARVTGRRLLTGPDGAPVDPGDIDSEGIALGPDGGMVLSFEFDTGLWVYPDPMGTPAAVPMPPDPIPLHPNAQYEAVAIAPDGRIVTLPERSGRKGRGFPIWAHDGTGWTLLRRLPRRDDFLPVGADFAPDGSFYLLERAFTVAFHTRIRRIDIFDSADEGQVIYQSDSGSALNYEGLSAWQDADGRTRLVLVSDNNFIGLLGSFVTEIPLASKAEGG